MAISVCSTSFGSAQLTQHKCIHLFPPPEMPLAHTGGSHLSLSSCSVCFHWCHKCAWAIQTDFQCSALFWTECPCSSRGCLSLSVKEAQWITPIFCPTAHTPCSLSHLAIALLPNVVFAHPINSSSSWTSSMFSIWVLLSASALSPSSRCNRLIQFPGFS